MKAEEQIRHLQETVEQLKTENEKLLSRNMQLSEQLCMWYELRQHVNWLKAEMEIDRRNVMLADLTDDAELLSVIETRLEQDTSLLKGDFSGAQLAELIGVSQARLARLFRNTTYKSADDYLDFVRLVRAMKLLREHPEYGIVGVSEDAGFKSVRTFQRHMQEAVGMSPVEFRMMLEKNS
jgi:transcriptional regulator GlxA family with amidase domain